MRVAVYYAPALDDPLWRAGCTWLGRDPETGASLPQPGVPGLAESTADPRRYGFHATLKPPMRLRTSFPAFLDATADLARRRSPFDLPALDVADLSGFLALRESSPCPALNALADACVVELDDHRDPPGEDELARRRHSRLGPEEDAMLLRWGYPHVLATWRFHMTLSQRLQPAQHEVIRPAAEAYFAGLLGPRRVDTIAIYTEREPGAPFLLAERLPLSA